MRVCVCVEKMGNSYAACSVNRYTKHADALLPLLRE